MKNLIASEPRALPVADEDSPALRARRRFAHKTPRPGERGQYLVEAAFFLPVLCILFLGLFYCSILFCYYIELCNAVGQGADYLGTLNSSVAAGTVTDPCAATVTVIENAAPMLNASSLNFSIYLSASQSTASGSSCPSATLTSGATAAVTASYPASLFIYGKSYIATNISHTVKTYVY